MLRLEVPLDQVSSREQHEFVEQVSSPARSKVSSSSERLGGGRSTMGDERREALQSQAEVDEAARVARAVALDLAQRAVELFHMERWRPSRNRLNPSASPW